MQHDQEKKKNEDICGLDIEDDDDDNDNNNNADFIVEQQGLKDLGTILDVYLSIPSLSHIVFAYLVDVIIFQTSNPLQRWYLLRRDAELCDLVTTFPRQEYEINGDAKTIDSIVQYLKHHRGQPGAKIPTPSPFSVLKLEDVGVTAWDGAFIKSLELEVLLDVCKMSNYLALKPLFELGSAYIALQFNLCTPEGIELMNKFDARAN
jgi:hypothetical protein